ncbi:MAG: hypothetical protein JNK82_40890 [Myxococcaceae bacterium]|nr:hypothetical protein [Myxococcaceae bacterium]
MTAPALRPMALGEIVDRSATFWRAHWRRLYPLFFGFNVLQYAALKGGQALMGQGSSLTELVTMLRSAAQNPDVLRERTPTMLVGTTAVLLLLMFGTLFVTTAAAHWVLPTFLGEPAKLVDGVKHAGRRFGTLVGLFFIAAAWALVVFVLTQLPALGLSVAAGLLASPALLIVGMLLMALTMLGWMMWFFLRFALWGPVVAAEAVGPLGAFRRTGALTSGRVGPGLMGLVKMRLMILITVVAMLLLLISLISSVPVLVLQGMYGNLLDPAAGEVPAVLLVPAELLNLAAGAVMYPLYVAFQVIFYVDLRVRREGLDLELQLKAAA